MEPEAQVPAGGAQIMAARSDRKVRLCIVGHFGPSVAEGDVGTRNVNASLAQELTRRHEVMCLDIRSVRSWPRLRGYRPDIIFFILGPATLMSFPVMAAVRSLWRRARTVLLATLPIFRPSRLVTFLKPDLVLAQSYESQRMFEGLNCRAGFLPNGVDLDRFKPIEPAKRADIRRSLGLEATGFLILHVGPILRDRNVESLARLKGEHDQVVVVGRTPADESIQRHLEAQGCTVWLHHLKNIEQLYAVSDCYVFPALPLARPASIDFPLSVLEAMACNLPVVSTKFRSLPSVFESGNGLEFATDEKGFREILDSFKAGGQRVNTRDKVMPFSWSSVCDKLDKFYEQLLAPK